MKKTIFVLAAAVTVLAASSCEKGGLAGKATINATITEEYIDGSNALYWEKGSSFSLFPGTMDNIKYTLSSGAGTRSAKFKTDENEAMGASIDANVAVSPYNSEATVVMVDGEAAITTSVPAVQTFSSAGVYDSGVCPLISVTSGRKGNDLPFVAPLGGISFKLTGEYVISKVEVTANGGEIINGDLTVKADKDGVKSVEMTGGTSTLVLDCGTGIQLTQVAKDFVFFVPYGTYQNGFTAKVYTDDGNLNVITVDGPKTVHKARVLNVSRQQFVVYSDINASSDERANCYMISAAGGYYFDATVKGNGASGIHSTFKDQSATLSPDGAKLIWEEVKGLVTGVSFENGKIYFACSGKDGNALIGATDASGNIIWSWHIWSTEAPADLSLGNWVFMDRNLGAKSTDDHGLYYQWGRKDPISSILSFDSAAGEGKYHPVEGGSADNESVKNTIEYAVSHPASFIAASSRNKDWLLDAPQRHLWGLDFSSEGLVDNAPLKTVYDPCPAGYSVPTTNAYAAGLSAGSANEGSYITLFGGQLKIPAGGFIYSGGYGWYGQDSYSGVWSCSSSWGNLDNAFRLSGTNDARDNYDRATGHPVRCVKFKK